PHRRPQGHRAGRPGTAARRGLRPRAHDEAGRRGGPPERAHSGRALRLRVATSVASASTALAHCVEGGYGPGANPVTTLSAVEGIRVLSANVPLLARDARDIHVRSALLYGAYLAGTVIATVGVGLHHRTCHVLGGSYGLAHAASNAVVLAHAIA